MLVLVTIDLSKADLALFEAYEVQALALLSEYGAKLEDRLRSVDGGAEMHLLYFPDAMALNRFKADPARMALQNQWLGCGASSTLSEVIRID